VLAEAIQHAIEQGFKLLHLSAGADRSKLRWRPEELVHQEFRFTSPHARSRLARGVYQGAARLAASGPLAYMTQRYLMRRAPTAE
jgi:CelD/BcsL family acetyltransferase involved in cellulose biosynthesis